LVDTKNDETQKGESTEDYDSQNEACAIEAQPPKLFSQSKVNDLV